MIVVRITSADIGKQPQDTVFGALVFLQARAQTYGRDRRAKRQLLEPQPYKLKKIIDLLMQLAGSNPDRRCWPIMVQQLKIEATHTALTLAHECAELRQQCLTKLDDWLGLGGFQAEIEPSLKS